jgi:hypothetical protein
MGNDDKVKKAGKRRISNKAIVNLKLFSACLLLFSCCLFFFQNTKAFEQDLGLNDNPISFNIVFPVIFFAGIFFIVVYMANMLIRLESKTLWKADRLYILYQVVFFAVLVVVILRWFFLEMSNFVFPSLMMIVSGIMTLVTPKIVDNNNDEF